MLLHPLLRATGLLLVASLLIFFAAAALPGDAIEVRSGGRVTAAELAQLRAAAGLDRPLLVRWLDWLGGLSVGDPGRSLITGRPVGELVTGRIPVSTALVVGALAVVTPLTLALAWLGSRGPDWARSTVTAGTAAAAALPQVVVAGALVALLSTTWDLLPPVSLFPAGATPWSRPDLLVLPVLTLALPTAAYAAGLLRAGLQDAVGRPFVRDAVLRGIPARTVTLRYVLPTVAPLATRLLAVLVGSLVAGTTVVETLFGIAGLGELLVTAIGARDAPTVQAVALLAAAVVVAGLLLADAVATATDPRAAHR